MPNENREGEVMKIYCVGCGKDVSARLTDGKEMYPHRKDLSNVPFWACECGAFVGCHWKTSQPTRPLGVLATQELKNVRKEIHAILDPLWRSGQVSRGKIYASLSQKLGYEYHTGETRSVEEAQKVLKIAQEFKQNT